MSGLLGFLVAIIILALILYICFWALGQIPLPQPIRTVIVVVVALVLVVYLATRFGLLAGL
jgi:hypothetical protein